MRWSRALNASRGFDSGHPGLEVGDVALHVLAVRAILSGLLDRDLAHVLAEVVSPGVSD